MLNEILLNRNKVSQVIAELSKLDPNDLIIVEYYTKKDCEEMLDEEDGITLTEGQWQDITYSTICNTEYFDYVADLVWKTAKPNE